MVPFHTLDTVSYNNFVPKTRRFQIIDFKKCRDLEIWVRELKVIESNTFDRLCVVSYYCSIVTLSVKRIVSQIFDFKNAVTLKTGLGVREGH